jgi:hypothetical protein
MGMGGGGMDWSQPMTQDLWNQNIQPRFDAMQARWQGMQPRLDSMMAQNPGLADFRTGMQSWLGQMPQFSAGMTDPRAMIQAWMAGRPQKPEGLVRPDRAFNGGANPTPEQIAARNRARPTPLNGGM